MKNESPLGRIFFALILLIGLQAAAGARPMTPESLWGLGRLSDPQVSPDGAWVVFGVSEYDLGSNRGNRDLYVMPTRGGTPRKVTAFQGSEHGARWRPDGKKIGFLTSQSGSVQLWEMNPDGSDQVQVSHIEGGISNLLYSPSGDHVAFTRDVKLDKSVQEQFPDLPEAVARIEDSLMFRHWDTWHDGTYSHLFVAPYRNGKVGEPVDVMPGQRQDTPLSPFGGAEHIGWSPDGSRIAYTSKASTGTEYARSTNSDIFVYNLRERTTRNVSRANPGYDVEPVFWPDKGELLWLSMETPGYEADRQRLMSLNLSDGRLHELSRGFDQNAGSPLVSRDAQRLFFVSGVRGTEQIFSYTRSSGEIRQITRGMHDYMAIQPGPDDSTLIATRMSMSHPAEIFRVDTQSGEARQLTFINRDRMSDLDLGRVEERTVETTDGKQMLVWVIYPPDFDPGRRYPALLYCQGGPQGTVSQFFSYRWNFQLMAAGGYIVVAPNRRGLPSFGQDWNAAISGDWGGQAMRDLLSASDALAKEPYVDQDRLGAVGASFGGYSVFWLAGNHQGRFKAFISHDGVFNLESMYGSTEEIFFVDHEMKGPYWKSPKPPSYDAFSPHRFVNKWDTPILIIHGEQDFRVPVAESLQAFTAAQLKGVPSRFLYFPEENHWVLTPQNGVLWQRVFFDWLGRYLK